MELWEVENQRKVMERLRPNVKTEVANVYQDLDYAVQSTRPGNGLYSPSRESYLSLSSYPEKIEWTKVENEEPGVFIGKALEKAIAELAEIQGISKEEALTRAIADELHLKREIVQSGCKFLMQQPNGQLREVEFKGVPGNFQ